MYIEPIISKSITIIIPMLAINFVELIFLESMDDFLSKFLIFIIPEYMNIVKKSIMAMFNILFFIHLFIE